MFVTKTWHSYNSGRDDTGARVTFYNEWRGVFLFGIIPIYIVNTRRELHDR